LFGGCRLQYLFLLIEHSDQDANIQVVANFLFGACPREGTVIKKVVM
jgi:hypothetical protein